MPLIGVIPKAEEVGGKVQLMETGEEDAGVGDNILVEIMAPETFPQQTAEMLVTNATTCAM
jgi:hypothetical protein